MPYAQHTAWPPGYYQTHCAQSGTIWAQELHHAQGDRSDTVQPNRSPNGTMLSKSNALTIPTLQKQITKSGPGTTWGSHQVPNIGHQLICWLCIAKKPAFMLIHKFMWHQTQLFSYLDNVTSIKQWSWQQHIITTMTWIHLIMRIHMSHLVFLF